MASNPPRETKVEVRTAAHVDADDSAYGAMFDVANVSATCVSLLAIAASSDWVSFPNVMVYAAMDEIAVARDKREAWSLVARTRFGINRGALTRISLDKPLVIRSGRVMSLAIVTHDPQGLRFGSDGSLAGLGVGATASPDAECVNACSATDDMVRLGCALAITTEAIAPAPFGSVGETPWTFVGAAEYSYRYASEDEERQAREAAAAAKAKREAEEKARREAEEKENRAAANREAERRAQEHARAVDKALEHERVVRERRLCALRTQLQSNTLQPFLSCGVCREVLTNPVTLPRCEHVFCAHCVVDVPILQHELPASAGWKLVIALERSGSGTPARRFDLRCDRHAHTIKDLKRMLLAPGMLPTVPTEKMTLSYLEHGSTRWLQDDMRVATYGIANEETLDLCIEEGRAGAEVDTRVLCPTCGALVYDRAQELTDLNMPPAHNARITRLANEYRQLANVFGHW
eukprot:g2024.t1